MRHLHYLRCEVLRLYPLHRYLETATATMAANYPYYLLEQRFVSVIGPNAVEVIRSSVTSNPVITVGGDQLTGKSTLAKNLARTMGGETR